MAYGRTHPVKATVCGVEAFSHLSA
jgi:hypothetical protein